MSDLTDRSVLDAVLEAWDRHNTVMLNLLRELPEGGLDARAMPDSPTVGAMFSHIHHERLVSVHEEAPEHAIQPPEQEWRPERDAAHIEAMLQSSAKVVRAAVESRVLAGRELDLNFGHPVLMLQFLLWHDAYHHGQMKLALKAVGTPFPDMESGPLIWDVWRARKEG